MRGEAWPEALRGRTSGVGRTAEEWGVRWTGQGGERRLGLAGIMPKPRRPWTDSDEMGRFQRANEARGRWVS